MKIKTTLFTIFGLILFVNQIKATTYTTTSFGAWNNSSRWANGSVPPSTIGQSDTVLINHNTWLTSGTSITVNGVITVSVQLFRLNQGSSITNNGEINALEITNFGSITNNGTINISDDIFNRSGATITNTSSGSIILNGAWITNATLNISQAGVFCGGNGTISNSGNICVVQGTTGGLSIVCGGGNYTGNAVTQGCQNNSSSNGTANHTIPLQVCTGDTVVYSFDITSSFNVGNAFSLELSNTSGTFNGNIVSTSNLLAHSVSTNNTIDVLIPDTITPGSYSIRLVSTNPATICDTISNIVIGESPQPMISYFSNGMTNSIGNNDTILACESDSILLISSTSNSPTQMNWQWYQDGIPIAGATNDSLWLSGANAQGEYYVNAAINLCATNSNNVYFEVETYTGSVTTSSQYYNPPNTITAIATGGTSYQWFANKPVFIDNVTNDTVEVALMSDSTTLAVHISYGSNCMHTHSVLLLDTSNTFGINPPTFEYQVLVYPNPTNSYLYIDVPQNMIGQSYSLDIKNSIGQSIFAMAMNQTQLQVNLNSFGAAGFYTLSIIDSGGNIVDNRVILLQ